MGNSSSALSAPITDHTVETVSGNGLRAALAYMQGYRPTQEDAHVCEPSLAEQGKPHLAYFALFDGHGGAQTSAYAAERLLLHIASTEAWRRDGESVASLQEALLAGFVAMEADLRTRGFPCGCTAVAAIVTPTHVVCANAGDSRALGALLGGRVKWVTLDHKPTDPPEEARIKAAGGSVSAGRVNGDLALSRALGDFRFKDRKGTGPGGWAVDAKQLVSSVPDLYVSPRGAGDGCLVLACDGVWDVMSNEDVAEACNTVRGHGPPPLFFFFCARAPHAPLLRLFLPGSH